MPETMQSRPSSNRLLRLLTLAHARWVAIAVTAYCAFWPLLRATLRLEIKYNEGWNAYNAAAIAHHQWVYPVRYGWTMANYPVLSFVAVSQMGRLTHDYLYAGRLLNLLGLTVCCLCAGTIVSHFTGSRRSGAMGGVLCLVLFCTSGQSYVGMNDPQILAQSFFMAGLLLYILRGEKPWALALTALLFVIGGNTKHNLIDFPIAVALELALVNRRRLASFVGLMLLWEVPLYWINLHVGGPEFLHQILVARRYVAGKILGQTTDYFGPQLIPLALGIYMAWRMRHDPRRRLLSIFFAVALVVGIYFSGGEGVALNTYFSATLALAMLLGLFLHYFDVPRPGLKGTSEQWRAGATALLFLWMLIPLACEEVFFPVENWRNLHQQQERYLRQVDFLKAQPGPALCESILRCYDAGKPYVFDPFSAASLIRAGQLDENELIGKIAAQHYGAIQFNRPALANGSPNVPVERYTPGVVQAVARYYQPALREQDCTIYVPRR